MRTTKRLYFLISAIILTLFTGTTGYYIIFKADSASLLDSLYMTVISLTGVGYGEVFRISGNPTAQIFTMLLITFGMGILLYSIGTLTAVIIESDLSGIFRKKKMKKDISKLSDHIIICGGGETGLPIIEELAVDSEDIVLIEIQEDVIDKCRKTGTPYYIHGDATDDQNLLDAGIERAKGILIALPSDKDTLYVTMTARMISRHIKIISKMADPKLEPKLRKAGADGVVSPNMIGALRMVSEMIRPTAVDFLDKMLRSDGNLRIHEILIPDTSNVLGKAIMHSGLKGSYNILILGLKSANEGIEFNPPPSRILTKGMTLIVMGDADHITKAKKAFSEA